MNIVIGIDSESHESDSQVGLGKQPSDQASGGPVDITGENDQRDRGGPAQNNQVGIRRPTST